MRIVYAYMYTQTVERCTYGYFTCGVDIYSMSIAFVPALCWAHACILACMFVRMFVRASMEI